MTVCYSENSLAVASDSGRPSISRWTKCIRSGSLCLCCVIQVLQKRRIGASQNHATDACLTLQRMQPHDIPDSSIYGLRPITQDRNGYLLRSVKRSVDRKTPLSNSCPEARELTRSPVSASKDVYFKVVLGTLAFDSSVLNDISRTYRRAPGASYRHSSSDSNSSSDHELSR
jgi:hypothetical protein